MKQQLPWTEWFDKAKAVKTTDDFKALFDEMYCDYDHSYDSAVHAASALALAGAWLGCRAEGLTGFQAGHIKFDFLREWDGIGKEVGISVIDYDRWLCYPQYVTKCPVKTISLDTWKRVQKVCANKLNALDTCEYHLYNGGYGATRNHACYSVRQYWADVCNGIIPECLRVVEDVDASEGIGYSRIDPIPVTRPAHTIADKERGCVDRTSPWFDEERAKREYKEWRKKYEGDE